MTVDIKKITAAELDVKTIDALIDARDSFQVVAVTNISAVVTALEGRIEKKDLSCRVYTEFRSAALTAAVIPTPVTVLGGWAAGVAIGAHNLATWNPDYEIAKNKAMSNVTVTYKK